MVQITRFLVGACFLIINGATALDWSVRSIAETASRDNPQTGVFNPEALASAKSSDVARLLAIESSQDVQLPLPDGTIHTFRIHPSSIMASELAAKHRNIRAFEGESAPSTLIHSQHGLKHEKISVVLSVSKTAVGGTELHAQYVSNKRGYMHLEPSKDSSPTDSELSFRISSRDAIEATSDFECHTEDESKRKLMEDALVSSHLDLIQNNRRKLQENGCNVETLGNFQCDPNNNREECNFDAGDCCGGFKERVAECTPNDDPTSCLCKDRDYLTVNPRTLRLAVAANVEFSAYYNSNRDAVMAQIVHTFTRVAGLFRREVGIGLEIVHTHIETDPNTRVLGHSDTWSVAQQLPAVFDGAIGNDAYDIGHCLIGAAGGVAGDIGVACNPATKAMGVTGRGKFEGDLTEFVDVVIHEMGHQLGSHHMFSGCFGNPGTPGFRVEPGGGTTFMSYAGICDFDDIQKSPSPYFHTLSLESIRRYMSNPAGGASCGYMATEAPVDRPTVEAQISLLNPTVRRCAIPPSTPFRLSAVGAPITDGYYYSWEQVDNTEDEESNGLDNTPPADGALFRSIPPKQNDASRTFPSLELLLGRIPELYHERLPPTPRELEFVLGVRKEYIASEVIDTTSFYLTDYSAFYVGDSVKVTVADVAPLQVSSVVVAENQPDDNSQITFDVTWTGGNLASTVRVVAADGNVQSPDFSVLLGSGLNNDGRAQVTASLVDICTTAPGSQAVLYVKVESDAYLDGCSYFAIAPSPVFVDCFDVTLPPTVPPTPANLVEVEFEYGPEDGNFTENGLEPSVPYENSHIYKYLITGQPGKKILLEFIELDVESNYDYVNVYDGETDSATELLRHTGQGNGRTVLSSGNKLYMTLVTDEVVQARGFVVRHTSVDESFTAAPTVSPTESPTEHREYVDVYAVEGSKSFNISVDVTTTLYVKPSLLASTMTLKFDTPTYGFYAYVESVGQTQQLSIFVQPNDPVTELQVSRGYFVVEFQSFNQFPVEAKFTVTETEIESITFGPVIDFMTLSRDGAQVGVASFSGTDDEMNVIYNRGVTKVVDGSVRFFAQNLGSDTICFVARGDASEDEFSYKDNLLLITTDSAFPSETVTKFFNDFPQDLGDLSDVPTLIRSEGDYGLEGYLIEQESAVTVTCGHVAGSLESPSFMFALEPLLGKEPLTTSGTITAQDNNVINYLQYYSGNTAMITLSGLAIQSTNGEPVTLQFVNPPDQTFYTHIFSTSLTAALFGTSASGMVHTFGGASGNPYPTQPITIGGAQIVSIAFVQASQSTPPTAIPEEFEISYSVGGVGNFTEPLPGDNIGDQVNKVDIDTSNPTYFKSGTQPFGTKEHALNERWEFVAPEGYSLKITFSVLDVEESADFVHLYAGTQVGNANRVQSFTGSYVPPAIVIENNAMVLRVVRDGSDDRAYRGVQGVVEVVREDSQWYLYVIGAMGVVTVGAVALLVKKTRGGTSTAAEHDEEAMTASAIDFIQSHKRESDESGLLATNPLFDANDI